MDGQTCQQERSLLQPHFLSSTLQDSIPKIWQMTQQVLQDWDRYTQNNQFFDISYEMFKIVLVISVQVLFEYSLSYSEIMDY